MRNDDSDVEMNIMIVIILYKSNIISNSYSNNIKDNYK